MKFVCLRFLCCLIAAHFATQSLAGENEVSISAVVTASADTPFQRIVPIIDILKKHSVDDIQVRVMKDGQGNGIAVSIRKVGTPVLDEAEMTEIEKQLTGAGEIRVVLEAKKNNVDWIDYRPERLEELRKGEKAVVVFCHADWCPTCQMIKQKVFADDQLIKAIQKNGVSLVSLDYTRPNKELKQFLADLGTEAVPTIVVYSVDKNIMPKIISGMLSKNDLLERLDIEIDEEETEEDKEESQENPQ